MRSETFARWLPLTLRAVAGFGSIAAILWMVFTSHADATLVGAVIFLFGIALAGRADSFTLNLGPKPPAPPELPPSEAASKRITPAGSNGQPPE